MNNKTFAEKHPKLNIILGLSILILLSAGAIIVIKHIFELLAIFANWIGAFVSTHDAVITVALITGVISLLTVFIGKIFEYKNEKRKYLSQKREKPYGEFIEMVYKIMDNAKNPGSYTDKEMVVDVMKFSEQITLWGSRKVANKWVEFRKNGLNTENAQKNLLVLESIMNQMRHDLGVKRVKDGNLLSFFVNDLDIAKIKKSSNN